MLTSASSIDDIIAAYVDNVGYDANGSVSQAQAFAQACRILLIKIPKRTRHGHGSEIEIDPATIRAELKAAQAYIAAHSSGVIHADFTDFRE